MTKPYFAYHLKNNVKKKENDTKCASSLEIKKANQYIKDVNEIIFKYFDETFILVVERNDYDNK